MGCSGSKSTNIANTTSEKPVADASAPPADCASCDKPTFFINWASPVSRSVMMTAHEVGCLADACVKEIDLMKGEQKSEEYLKVNPNGTVPTYCSGETKICESRDIACHLAKGTALYPDDEECKCKVDELLAYDKDTIFPALAKLMKPLVSGGGPAPAEERADLHAAMCHINTCLGENEYLTGTCPTLADIFVFNNFCQVALDPTFECPEGIDAVKAWKTRMEAVPCTETACAKFKAVQEQIAAFVKEKMAAEQPAAEE